MEDFNRFSRKMILLLVLYFIVLVFLFVLFPPPAKSASIKGYVLDFRTSDPIEGALVTVHIEFLKTNETKFIQVDTDKNGFWSAGEFNYAKMTFKVTKEGYMDYMFRDRCFLETFDYMAVEVKDVEIPDFRMIRGRIHPIK